MQREVRCDAVQPWEWAAEGLLRKSRPAGPRAVRAPSLVVLFSGLLQQTPVTRTDLRGF